MYLTITKSSHFNDNLTKFSEVYIQYWELEFIQDFNAKEEKWSSRASIFRSMSIINYYYLKKWYTLQFIFVCEAVGNVPSQHCVLLKKQPMYYPQKSILDIRYTFFIEKSNLYISKGTRDTGKHRPNELLSNMT